MLYIARPDSGVHFKRSPGQSSNSLIARADPQHIHTLRTGSKGAPRCGRQQYQLMLPHIFSAKFRATAQNEHHRKFFRIPLSGHQYFVRSNAKTLKTKEFVLDQYPLLSGNRTRLEILKIN